MIAKMTSPKAVRRRRCRWISFAQASDQQEEEGEEDENIRTTSREVAAFNSNDDLKNENTHPDETTRNTCTSSATIKLSKWPTSFATLLLLTMALLALSCASIAQANPAARRLRRAQDERLEQQFQHSPGPDYTRRQEVAEHQKQYQQDLAAADQLDEPMALEVGGLELLGGGGGGELPASSADHGDQAPSASSAADSEGGLESAYSPEGGAASVSSDQEGDEAMDSSRDQAAAPDEQQHFNIHNSHLRAMRDMFERRQLNAHNQHPNQHNFKRQHANGNNNNRLGQSSQELSPISIGLDPNSPFSMPPFAVGGEAGGPQPPPPQLAPMMAPKHPDAASLDQPNGGGGGLPFGLNPLPHLLSGFQGNFEGPQRGDQSAHANHHAAASSQSAAEPEMGPPGGPKVWPKIFRFTDGRINLSDFEKQKKMRLSSKQHGDSNHIDSAPIMFDGRQLKRKSFLILHGGVFDGNIRRRR